MSQDHFLDPSDISSLERYAKGRGFISADESLVSAEKAGEGNMNLTLRLKTDTRSFILKQARPWVEKYPQIPAPDSRALVETAFYEAATTRTTLRDAMPKLLASDPDARVLVLEDLGEARDFTSLYSGDRLSQADLDALVSYLVALHVRWKELPKIFNHREMRVLNHKHIFRLPLQPDNGIDLEAFTDGVRIIDPEFCFMGTAAFDVGVMLGHLYLANQPEELIDRVFSSYGADASTAALSRQCAGVEIMRRLIGVAQLPLGYGIDKKRELLELSQELVLTA